VLAAAGALLALALPLGARGADLAAGKAKAALCAPCHGAMGISEMTEIPSLAGQPDPFIQWQLVYFRSGTRKNPAMAPLIASLGNEDIRNLGAYFASLTPPPAAPGNPEPARAATGRALAAHLRCGSCHGADYSGRDVAPRLAGQREEYLLKALRDFKSGVRTGGGVASMPEVVYPLADAEFQALAYFLARYRK